MYIHRRAFSQRSGKLMRATKTLRRNLRADAVNSWISLPPKPPTEMLACRYTFTKILWFTGRKKRNVATTTRGANVIYSVTVVFLIYYGFVQKRNYETNPPLPFVKFLPLTDSRTRHLEQCVYSASHSGAFLLHPKIQHCERLVCVRALRTH